VLLQDSTLQVQVDLLLLAGLPDSIHPVNSRLVVHLRDSTLVNTLHKVLQDTTLLDLVAILPVLAASPVQEPRATHPPTQAHLAILHSPTDNPLDLMARIPVHMEHLPTQEEHMLPTVARKGRKIKRLVGLMQPVTTTKPLGMLATTT
jgi:hypothetical protein